jgi:hypothetical protein
VGGLTLFVTVAGLLAMLLMRLDASPGRYPGSVPDISEGFDKGALGQGGVGWQTVSITENDLATVKSWYLQRLGIAASSDMNLAAVNDCIWLSQAKSTLLLTHTVTVLACSVPRVTRIVVNHGLRLGP